MMLLRKSRANKVQRRPLHMDLTSVHIPYLSLPAPNNNLMPPHSNFVDITVSRQVCFKVLQYGPHYKFVIMYALLPFHSVDVAESLVHCRDGGVTPINVESCLCIDWSGRRSKPSLLPTALQPRLGVSSHPLSRLSSTSPGW